MITGLVTVEADFQGPDITPDQYLSIHKELELELAAICFEKKWEMEPDIELSHVIGTSAIVFDKESSMFSITMSALIVMENPWQALENEIVSVIHENRLPSEANIETYLTSDMIGLFTNGQARLFKLLQIRAPGLNEKCWKCMWVFEHTDPRNESNWPDWKNTKTHMDKEVGATDFEAFLRTGSTK